MSGSLEEDSGDVLLEDLARIMMTRDESLRIRLHVPMAGPGGWPSLQLETADDGLGVPLHNPIGRDWITTDVVVTGRALAENYRRAVNKVWRQVGEGSISIDATLQIDRVAEVAIYATLHPPMSSSPELEADA